MIHRPVLAAVAALLVSHAAIAAQERPFPYTLGSHDAVVLGAGLGLSLLGDQVTGGEDPLTPDRLAPLTAEDINGFDRTAARNWSPTWGDRSDWSREALMGAAAVTSFGPLVPRVLDGRWREAATLGTMFAEAYLLLRGATYTAKGLAGRTRPWVHNAALSVEERLAISDADPQDAFESFYSGHSAAAFGLATLLSKVFTDVRGRSTASDVLWASSLSVAGFTAYARVKAGMHYPSDVLVGAAVGAAVGYGVPWLHRAEGKPAVEVSAGPGGVAVRIPF